MAIVWGWASSVEAYAACGTTVEVPRAACPSCGAAMGFWSGYWRQLRVEDGIGWRIWVRRGRCSSCRVSHALLPSFCLAGRSFGVEVIGPAVQEMAGGRGTGSVARAVGVAQSTIRGWWQRHRERSRVAHAVAVMVAVVVGLGVAELVSPVEVSVLASLEVLARAAGGKESLGRWPAVSLVTGGMWLIPVSSPRSTTSRVYPNGTVRRLMALIDPNDEMRPP
jgi:Domain of unknown function (DUF6431)